MADRPPIPNNRIPPIPRRQAHTRRVKKIRKIKNLIKPEAPEQYYWQDVQHYFQDKEIHPYWSFILRLLTSRRRETLGGKESMETNINLPIDDPRKQQVLEINYSQRVRHGILREMMTLRIDNIAGFSVTGLVDQLIVSGVTYDILHYRNFNKAINSLQQIESFLGTETEIGYLFTEDIHYPQFTNLKQRALYAMNYIASIKNNLEDFAGNLAE